MNFNAELLNEARNEGYSEKEIWNYISSQNPKFNEAKQEGYSLDDVAGYFTKSAAPAQERDALQTVAEELEAGIGRAGGAFAQAAVGSVRMITDAFGANNPVSKKISGVEDYLDQFVSAQARQDKEEISRLFQEAEGKGLGAKVMAGLEAVAVSPETLGPEIAGYMLPSLAVGILASFAAAPTAVAIGAQAAIGGIQSAGTIKGEIYKSVRDFSREQGLTEEQADKAASEAQAYGGKNLDQILISAGIGAVAASTGVERIATRILSGQGKEVTKKSIGEFIKTGLKAAPVEGVVEGVQEGQEQMAKNIALQREGADVSTFKMVPQVTTMGTVAGGLMGGAAGGIEYVSAEQKKLTDIEKTSDREARMLSAPDAASKNIINFLNQTENGIDSLREELDTLEPTDPKAQNLRMRISEEQKKADAIMVSIGEKKETALSEPITKAEEEQARLAMEIAAPVEEAVTPPVEPADVVEAPAVTPPVSPAQAVEQLEVSIPVSGQPFEFLSIRNTEQAPQLGTQFGQDIEPSGKYISQSTPDAARNLDERFEKGVIRFENPLVVEFGGEYGTPTNWKNVLSSQYEGKTGTELSQAVRDAGYDGIVTVEPSTGPNRPAQTSEIVDIRSIKPSVTTAAPTPVTTPPVTEAVTPAPTPAAPAVGNRIKLGRSPQAYTIEEVIPQTETEKELGEQYYNVKNEKTGEVQAVEAKDLKLVKKMPIRKAISKPVPTAPEKRVEIKSIVEVAMKMFGSDFVAGRLYVMDDVNEESKAGYDPEDGTIYLNLAFMDTDDSIRDLIAHELGHYIFGDPSLRSKFTEFINSLPKRERVILDRFVNKVYRKDTGEVKIEEKEVRAFIMRLNAGDNRNKFQKLLDGIKRWLNEKLGTKFKMTDRDAAILLAGAVDRFKSGELIEREEGFGVRKMAAERIDDRSQIAGVKGIGAMKDTPKGINKETESIIRRSVFNSDIVNDSQTKKAWDLIESIDEKNPDAGKNAQDINELTRETMQDANVDEIVKQTIGAAKLRNELFQYAIKLTAEGDRSMLDYLLNNRLALAGGAITEGDAGRLLQALSSLKSWIIRSSEAEKQGFFAVAAQQFFDTKTPTEEQVKQIQSMFEAVKKVKINQEKDLMEELEKVGKATGIDVAQTVEAEVRRGAKAKAESEADILTKEYNKIQTQAETQIERLANIQSDTPAFVKIKTNEIRKIVNDDLKNTPDMGRKDAWKSMLTAKLKDAGVNETDASLLSELVWRQHEINDTNRKMDEVVKAVEKGAIKGMVEAILNTPLSEQQNPEWRKDVIKNYLIEAGVASSKAESISKLFDLSLRKRFAQAQEKAAEKAAKAIMGKLTPNSRRALEKFIRAIRTQVLSPGSDVAKAFGEQMGWKGFTAEQYARLSELDSIVSNEDTLDLERATAFKEIQNIIASASIPPRVRDAISSFYVAQALSGIPTATVNVFSPIGYALRYAMTDGMKVAIKNPSKLPTVFSAMISSFKSYASEVAYSWNNNVQRRGVVEYLANDEKLLAVYNKGKKQWAEGNRAEGFKNMLFGSMEYVSRMLKALDEGALSVLEQQGLSRYAMAAMDKAGIKTSEQIAVANMVMKSKQEFILDSIAKGMSKRDATAFSDDVYRSAWQEALSKLKINSQQVLDSAINDALSAVGRINTTIDPLTGTEQKRISDRGFASSLPIGFLESISQAANSKDSNEIQRIFYRMMYGFAIVPARVFREAAWFSPYGFVRFALDKGAKSMGYTSPYEQSLGTDLQRTQRLTETIAGTIVMLGAMAMANSSVDDPEDELPFKVVFTGNGPDRRLDPQFFDTWRDKYKPNSINVFFGKTKFSINIERGFEAFAIPFMMAGAIDDWKIRKRFEQTKKTPKDISDATIILGSAFMSFNKRGPYAAFTNTYSSFKNSDNSIAELVKQGAFYGKTFIPVIGSSLARNVSDFINDPIDRTSLDGALYSNIPVLGPMMGTKSMNAVGQTQGATDFSDRLYKAGIPLVFSLPKNSGSEKINQIILKQGQGPSIPTRYNVRQRIGYEPNNKQYETFVTEYGKYMANKMTQNHDSLMNKKPTSYMKTIENWSDTARNIATKEAKKISNPNAP